MIWKIISPIYLGALFYFGREYYIYILSDQLCVTRRFIYANLLLKTLTKQNVQEFPNDKYLQDETAYSQILLIFFSHVYI